MVSVSSTLGSEKKGSASAPALVLLNKFDAARVEEALNYARLHAADHILDTQEPAIQHMLAVADLLAELRADANTRIAGALGPLVFFDKHLESQMEKKFGDEVGRMLASLRKLSKCDPW